MTESFRAIPIPAAKGNRYGFLDTIRGLVIISMVFYHLVWDMVHLLGVSGIDMRSSGMFLWQRSICWTFILLSGFCWPLGKRHFRRGITVFGAGMLVTAVTLAVMPQNRIVFGILTLLGSCMLLLIPLEKLLCKIPAAAGLALSLLLYFFTANVDQGYLGFGGFSMISLPQSWYQGNLAAYLGFLPPDFYSTDYFPLLPWLFLFLAGYFLNRTVSSSDIWRRIRVWNVPALSFLGRHSLLIYLLHQPLLYAIIQLAG